MAFFRDFRPYVRVEDRRREAEREIARLKKAGRRVDPVTLAGRAIADTFWGKSWCENLERYSDFASRLPRGRSYVRNGAVVDLQIAPGRVDALVSGSELYEIAIRVVPLGKAAWKALCADCAGGIDSLVELLQGRFAKGVMERICRQKTGLFPAPAEIRLDCSCPDAATMCKHVAAVLYGIGARLDAQPELLFRLRDVDEKELVAGAAADLPLARARPPDARILVDDDLGSLFGLDLATELAATASSAASGKPAPARRRSSRTPAPADKRARPRSGSRRR